MKPSAKVQSILGLDGWTQERMANQLRVAQSTVNRWFHADSEPRGQHRDAINELYAQLFEPDHIELTVKLVGYVGAGQAIYQFDEDGAGYVEAPPRGGRND